MIRLHDRNKRPPAQLGAIATWFYELSDKYEMWIEQRKSNPAWNLCIVDRRTRRIKVSLYTYGRADVIAAANAFAGDWP